MTICCIAAITAFSATPMLKVTEENINRNERTYTRKNWRVQFDLSSMVLRNTINSEGKLVAGTSEDYLFGLRHGTVNNGSWCSWNFMEVLDAEGRNLTKSALVKDVTFIKYDGGSYVDCTWENGSVKILQQKNIKDWVFVKAVVPSGIRQVNLRVWPGGTAWKALGRERRLKIADQDMELKGNVPKAIPFTGTECGIAFYNRNYSEQYGNFLVFEQDKVMKITGVEANSMTLRFIAKADVTEMCFALGYFAKEDPAEATQRFLEERLPDVKKTLDALDWNPTPDFSSFEATYKQVQMLVSAMTEPGKGDEEIKLNEIRTTFEQAKNNSDAAGCAKALDNLRAMQKRVGFANLNALP